MSQHPVRYPAVAKIPQRGDPLVDVRGKANFDKAGDGGMSHVDMRGLVIAAHERD